MNMSTLRKIFSEEQLIKGEAPPAVLEMIGGVYGWLIVKRYVGRSILESGKTGSAYILCKCKCGNKVLAQYSHVKGGKWLSCGCMKIEKHPRLKHGYSTKNTKLYYTWKSMHARCKYERKDGSNNKYFENGTKVCNGWSGENGFVNFKNDIGEPPTKQHSLDRIHCNLHYSCGHCDECLKNNWELNCRWADIYTQANNKSNNHYVTIDGNKLTYAQADRYMGYGDGTIGNRILLGWDINDAINIAPNSKQKRKKERRIYTQSQVDEMMAALKKELLDTAYTYNT